MSLKVTGAEWKKFYDDDTVWAGEAYAHGERCAVAHTLHPIVGAFDS